MQTAYLQFDGVGKTFPGVRALDGISFGVREGSVHALMGENGAGKSTLLKILSGAYQPDEGVIRMGGDSKTFANTSASIASGVAVIYQELQLFPELSVAENMFIGHLPARGGWVDRNRLNKETAKQLAVLGEEIDPRRKVGTLPIAQRQMVEIGKALSRDAKVIAFDEPTSSLSSREVDKLFAIIRQLRAAGKVILYVSHRMEEIFQMCDAATVFRDGRHVETFSSLANVTGDMLVSRMVGRSIEDIFRYSPRAHGTAALAVKGIVGRGVKSPVSFEVARGEILGFFGLVGAGRTELLKLIYGDVLPVAGNVSVGGKRARIRSPRDAIRAGLVLCPEDRKKEGIIPVRSVMENLNLSGRRHFSRLGFVINPAAERANAAKHVEKLGVRTPSLNQRIVNLSGGNQQKVILARWLSEDVKVILLDEPTRGIDVGAKSEIYGIVYALAARGVGVVVVSSELPEVLGICDRILVMRQGAIVANLLRAEATSERVLELALPVAEEIQPRSGAGISP